MWEAGIDRDEFFDAHACEATASARAKELLDLDDAKICGICIANCPFTKRGLGYK
jgi:heterodisulfide reductase subunit C